MSSDDHSFLFLCCFIRYTKASNNLQLSMNFTPANNMGMQTQSEIEQLIEYARVRKMC